MKSIINGKKYDTDSAELLGTYHNGLPQSDFDYYSVSLYRTKRSQQYFSAGEGGARTSYSQRYGNMYGAGERIDVLTKEEALSWAEEHLTSDEVEAAFPDDIEEA